MEQTEEGKVKGWCWIKLSFDEHAPDPDRDIDRDAADDIDFAQCWYDAQPGSRGGWGRWPQNVPVGGG